MIAEFALFTWCSSCSVFPGFEFSERTAFDCNFWRRRKSRSKWGASVVKVKGVGGDDIDCKGEGWAERGREGVRGGEPSSSSRFTARRAAGWEYTVHRLAWPSAKVSKKYPFRMIVHSVLSECQESPTILTYVLIDLNDLSGLQTQTRCIVASSCLLIRRQSACSVFIPHFG